VGREETTKSSEVQEHTEYSSLKLPCLLPSQCKLVTFSLCEHTLEVSCQTQTGRKRRVVQNFFKLLSYQLIKKRISYACLC